MNRERAPSSPALPIRLAAVLLSGCLLGLAWAPAARAEGKVSVRVDGQGNLIITGDNKKNSISISPFDVGEGDVIGLDSTLVNGGKSAHFSGVDNDFQIDMRGGDDTVILDDGDGNEAPDDVEISMGRGNDTVVVRDFIIHDDLIIRTGSGNDTVTLAQSIGGVDFVKDKTDIRTGSGDDQVLFEIGSLPNARLVFRDDFKLRTGSGRDFVNIFGAVFHDEVDVDLGDGDDMGEAGGVTGGLCVCNTTFEDNDVLDTVVFDGGDGNDAFVIESVEGIAPPGVINDFVRDFELEVDDCSFLGGVICGG